MPGRGQLLGTLSFLRLGPQRFGPEDLALLEALGVRAGLAIDNARLYEEQRDMVERLQVLRGQVEAAQRDQLLADERRRIARDLHDPVEQTFFAIELAATSGQKKGVGGEQTVERMADALAQVSTLAASGAEQLRASIFALTRDDVDGRGLVPDLWNLVRSFQHRTGIETDLVLTGPPCRLPTEIAEVLHAAAREALSNVDRHARASSVVLCLGFGRRTVTLTVQDDGVGVSALVLKQIQNSATRFGLRGLGDRVRGVHGSFTARPGTEGGFLMRVRVPLMRPAS